ncbi:MAG: serine hydrolase [Gammaproteobacteria bacterium]|nr:serine hydrolase [Gammaproteobacteria bacterium]
MRPEPANPGRDPGRAAGTGDSARLLRKIAVAMSEIMKGHPVSRRNRIPRQEWDRAPWNRWTFQHVREILPTAEVWKGTGRPWSLPENPVEVGSLAFASDVAAPMTITNWLDTSYTDGFIVLHRGQVVFEKYFNGMTERSLHLSQSMAKSVTGSVAGTLMDQGRLDPDEAVTSYLPELERTAWRGATLQQVMDMTTGVRYTEDYEAPDSDVARTDIACGWKLPRPGMDAPACMWDQIMTLTESTRPHGRVFEYRSIESDVLAHCMERVTGTRLADLVSQNLWQPLGCEENANFTVDSAGYSLACGGFNATLRDYARFGQMLLQNGFANGRRIISRDWVQEIHNSQPEIFHAPYNEATPNGAYHNQFWIEDVSRKAFMARGVFGQMIHIDQDCDMVVTKLSTWPEFTSVPRLKLSLSAIRAIADFLQS